MANDEAATDQEPLKLPEVASQLIEECRMVLPGIQALFGFQMVAVFNNRFEDKLSHEEQMLHLLAIIFVVVSIALVMTPAAYHRQVEPESVSRQFTRISSRLLLLGMAPLAGAIAIDFYLVAHLISRNSTASALVAAALAAVFVLLWVVLPRAARLKRLLGS